MDENKWLAELFEDNRSHLRAVAYRMLGSVSEADDAVQETWLRLSRSDAGAVKNLTGWLTTVTSRICLDILRSRQARREDPLDVEMSGRVQSPSPRSDPEQELLLADSVGLALLIILDTLNPAERLAFVLHDMFAVPFDEIAQIAGQSSVAVRQLASRARRRIRGKTSVQDSNLTRQRKVVEAFFAAARGGEFDQLLALLDPNVVLRADREALSSQTPAEIHGASAVAERALAGRSKFAEVAMIDGKAAVIVTSGRHLRRALLFTISRNKIIEIDVVANRERLRQLEIAPLPS